MSAAMLLSDLQQKLEAKNFWPWRADRALPKAARHQEVQAAAVLEEGCPSKPVVFPTDSRFRDCAQ